MRASWFAVPVVIASALLGTAHADEKREWFSSRAEDAVDGTSFVQAKANFTDPMYPRIYLKCQNQKTLLYFSLVGTDFPVGVSIRTIIKSGTDAPRETKFTVASKTDAIRLQLLGSPIDQDLYHSILKAERVGIRVFDPGSEVFYSGVFEITQPAPGLEPLKAMCP